MSVFICDKCKHIENTAMGTYWHKKENKKLRRTLNWVERSKEE